MRMVSIPLHAVTRNSCSRPTLSLLMPPRLMSPRLQNHSVNTIEAWSTKRSHCYVSRAWNRPKRSQQESTPEAESTCVSGKNRSRRKWNSVSKSATASEVPLPANVHLTYVSSERPKKAVICKTFFNFYQRRTTSQIAVSTYGVKGAIEVDSRLTHVRHFTRNFRFSLCDS